MFIINIYTLNNNTISFQEGKLLYITRPETCVYILTVYDVNTDEKTEFLMHMGEAPITVTAVAYPVDQFATATFEWSCSDEECLKITPSEDTRSCTCEILKPINGGVKLTASCYGKEVTIPVYLVD